MGDFFVINSGVPTNADSATFYQGVRSLDVNLEGVSDGEFVGQDWDIRWDDPNYYPVRGKSRGGSSPPVPPQVPELASVPSISGTAKVGEVLTAVASEFTGVPTPATTWQWKRNGVDISGATSITYTLVEADGGTDISVVQTVTNSEGSDSATSNEVTVQTPPVISGVPTISGTTSQGGLLTATAATVTGTPTPTRTWKWYRDAVAISGATSITYTLVSADLGTDITVVQTETNSEGTDTATSAATSIPSAPALNKYLIVSFGESNSGGYALNTDAASWEVGARSELNMWNVTSDQFEPLDIGTNNNLNHAGLGSTTHGWELGLANRIRQGWFDKDVYYLQTGQGGSTVGQWDVGDAYWTEFLSRVNLVKAAISNYIPVVWISLGINDAIAATPTATFKSAMEDIVSRIKAELPGCKIYIAGLPPVDSQYIANTTAISEIATSDGDVTFVSATSPVELPYRDANHWSYNGMKRLAARMVDAMSSDYPLSDKSLSWSAREDSGFVFTTAVNQFAHVSDVFTKATIPNIVCELTTSSAGLVLIIDGDVLEVTWASSPNSDPYYVSTFKSGSAIYGSTGNGTLNPASAVLTTSAAAWVRFRVSGDNILLETSIDGGATWTTQHTYADALLGSSDVRVKMLSAIGASNIDVWSE